MRLDIGIFPINEILVGGETLIEGDVLKIKRSELRQLVCADPRVQDVEIEVVKPGESSRVIHVCDAIEPRVKTAGPGACYPGVLGPVDTVGTGLTHRLRGMAVVLSAEYPTPGSGVGAVHEAMLDMSGPGALSPLAKTANLVLSVRFAPGYGQTDYHQALRAAGFKVSNHLARLTVGKTPAELQTYELTPVGAELPKVVYIHQLLTHVALPVPYLTWYGVPITDWMPFWAHPNEILDGALLPNSFGGYAAKPTSWEHVNHPLIDRLYRAHGKTLNFLGVILHRTRFEVFEEKQLSANQAAKLAKLMGGQGAIVTWIGAGNAFIEAMLTVQALERHGIRTVLMTYEHGGKDGRESPLLFSVPEADAIVSLGSLDRPIRLPAVKHSSGGADLSLDREAGSSRVPATGELALDWYLPVAGGLDHWGAGKQICVEY
jgi:glycine reductase complex component B subunit alpha and beta